MKRLDIFKNVSSDIFTTIFIGIYLFSIRTWNPDPHHDGIQYTSGIAVSQGKTPNLDFFEQYGPFNAYFHGAVQYIFGNQLLVLRNMTVGLLLLIAILMLLIMYQNKVGKVVRSILTIIWALSCPVTSLSDNIFGLYPWPSITVQLILLTCTFLLSKWYHTTPKVSTKSLTQVLSVLSIAALFTRFQVGVLLIVVLYFALKYANFNVNKKSQVQIQYAKYILLILIGVSIFSTMNESLLSFFDQIVVGPIGIYTVTMNWGNFIGFLKVCTPIGLIILSLYISEKYVRTKVWRYFSFVVVSIFAILIQTPYLNYQSTILRKLPAKVLESFSSQQLNIIALGYTLVFIALGLTFLEFLRISRSNWFLLVEAEAPRKQGKRSPFSKRKNASFKTITNLGILVIMSVPSIILLYPMPSQYHFWWSSPSVIVIIPCILGLMLNKKETKESFLILALLPTVFSLLFFWNSGLAREMFTLKDGIFKNMEVEPKYLKSYLDMNAFMEKNSQKNTSSICFDALFVSWDGNFNSNSPKVVSWAFGQDHTKPASPASRMFLCSDDAFAQNFSSVNKVRIINELEYQLSWWSKGKIFEYEVIK